jgi:aminoglycoside phosphotransferase (APT) family kinase protein
VDGVQNQTEAERVAQRLGITGVTGASRLKSGLGGTDLWRLNRRGGDLVLRTFPPGTPATTAEREATAHRTARRHGVSAPAPLAWEMIDDRPVLVIEWVPGELVADALRQSDDAFALGRRCGRSLATLHAIDDVPPVIAERGWIDWAGDRVDELDPLLRAVEPRVLVHLDFHPENLIISGSGEITVLDWANVRLGPPQADLARTESILELIMVAVPEVSGSIPVIADFGAGLLAGYADAGGDPRIPDAFRAWAYAVQLHDLVGSWVPDHYFDRLRRRYTEALQLS